MHCQNILRKKVRMKSGKTLLNSQSDGGFTFQQRAWHLSTVSRTPPSFEPRNCKTYKHTATGSNPRKENPSENHKHETTSECTYQTLRNRPSRALLQRNNQKKHTKKIPPNPRENSDEEGIRDSVRASDRRGEREGIAFPAIVNPRFYQRRLRFRFHRRCEQGRWRGACAACGTQQRELFAIMTVSISPFENVPSQHRNCSYDIEPSQLTRVSGI
jgi:hypothetical protein